MYSPAATRVPMRHPSFQRGPFAKFIKKFIIYRHLVQCMAKCLGPSEDEDCPHNLRGGGEDGRCLDCGDKYFVEMNCPTVYEKCTGPPHLEDCPHGNDAVPWSSSTPRWQISWELCASCEDARQDWLSSSVGANRAKPLPHTELPESYYNKYGGYDWNNKDA